MIFRVMRLAAMVEMLPLVAEAVQILSVEILRALAEAAGMLHLVVMEASSQQLLHQPIQHW